MERKITKKRSILEIKAIGGGNPILDPVYDQYKNRRCRCNSRTYPAVDTGGL